MTPKLAVLDVFAPDMSEIVQRRFIGEFDVRFAEEDSHAARVVVAESATVLLSMWGAVDASLIRAARACTVIHKLGVGVDKIDLVAAEAAGVAVLRAAGVNAEAVAELCVLLALSVGRNLPRALEGYRDGRFEKEALRAESFQLAGRTAGLVGFGFVGRAVALRFAAFGMTVLYHDVERAELAVEQAAGGARFVAFDELVAGSDVISLHLPLTSRTEHLFDDATFARMKRGAVLVNTARGGLVDEGALKRAVRSGRLSGAGLDVTHPEPLPMTSPLRSLDRVLITPHIGGAVADNFPRVVDHAYRNVRALLGGHELPPLDVVVAPPSPGDPRGSGRAAGGACG